jgi:hypothetical protein
MTPSLLSLKFPKRYKFLSPLTKENKNAHYQQTIGNKCS